MDWDDLRFVATLAREGSLLKTSAVLGVDHTTVGRRVAAAEKNLGLQIFLRTSSGYVLTREGEQLSRPFGKSTTRCCRWSGASTRSAERSKAPCE